MKIEPEKFSEIQDLSSDDDSCIFISDDERAEVDIDVEDESFGMDEESQHSQPSQEQSRIVDITDKAEDSSLKNLILRKERFVVTETTEITTERNLVNTTSAANVADVPDLPDFVGQVQEPPVVKLDKATQTEEKDFPKKLSLPESTNKQHTGLAASSPSCSKTVNPYHSRDQINNDKTDASVNKKSKNSDNSKTDAVKQTWKKTKTYRNYRVQPYQRYNYNNYNNWNHSQSNYNRRYNYKDQDNYNRYGIRTHSNYRNACYPNYTYQFKDRLFHGFVKFMDFVFHYNYANHRY